MTKNWTAEDAKQAYPPCYDDQDYFSTPYEYGPILESFGELIFRWDQDDYQGDTIALVVDGDNIGYVEFGWGSCSGCDALQASDDYEDVASLRNSMAAQVTWRSAGDMLTWLQAHDWRGDYSWHSSDRRRATRDMIDELLTRMGLPTGFYGTAAEKASDDE